MESQLEGSSSHSLPTTSALDHQYGTFVCGDHLFALPVAKVMEVIRFEQKLVKIPQTPDFVLGVFDFRGQGVPLIDIQKMMFDIRLMISAILFVRFLAENYHLKKNPNF